ncbi:MAG: cupin domain-containing protein [Balneolales bacterium]|nr:cupin domain-containing protein [Balneolales bacterium]
MQKAINLLQKFGLFQEEWTPKIIAETNGQLVKLAKLNGEFVWHNHADEDELFLVVKGILELRFKDHSVTLKEGELYVVPKGVDHLPVAHEECWVVLIEPSGTKHTGDTISKQTVSEDLQQWI